MNGAYVELARTHAPLLLITLPLIGAAAVLLAGSRRLAWLIGCLFGLATSVVAIDLAARGPGAAVAALNIALHPDGVAVLTAALLAAVAALVMIAAGAFLEDMEPRAAPLGLALLLCIGAGWSGALMARDLVSMAVAVETAWLAATGLIALTAPRDRAALNGALRMLSAGGVAAALMLLGVAMIVRATGSSNLDALPLAQLAAPSLAGAGVVMIVLALALKAGVAPLHAWASAALGRCGGAAMLGVGALSVLGALCMLVRFTAYAITAPHIGAGVSAALGVLGAASVVIGSVQAIGARSLPRLTAYAAASQAGCVLLSIALGSPAGFAAALVQLFALAAATLALYGGAAAGRIQSLSMLDGFGQRAPLASAAITAGALSLMGAPLTLGFLGRWTLVEAGVGAGWWWAAALVIVASFAAVFYGGRLVERVYFRRAGEVLAQASLWRFALAPALIAAIVGIAIGLAPGALLRWSAAASLMLMGPAA
ncbi:MAG: proton-conducting transporter transmembrane domain-containing protein [Caulobacteraceae bacterium]